MNIIPYLWSIPRWMLLSHIVHLTVPLIVSISYFFVFGLISILYSLCSFRCCKRVSLWAFCYLTICFWTWDVASARSTYFTISFIRNIDWLSCFSLQNLWLFWLSLVLLDFLRTNLHYSSFWAFCTKWHIAFLGPGGMLSSSLI